MQEQHSSQTGLMHTRRLDYPDWIVKAMIKVTKVLILLGLPVIDEMGDVGHF